MLVLNFKKNHKKITLILLLTFAIFSGYLLLQPYWENIKFEKAFKPSDKPVKAKILLVSGKRLGENEFVERLKIAAKRKNIDLRIVIGRVDQEKYDAKKDIVNAAAQLLKPDFAFAIEDNQMVVPGIPSYLALSTYLPSFIEFDALGKPKLLFNEHAKFDALLPTFKDVETIKIAFEQKGKKYMGFNWYFTSYVTDFKPAKPHKLLYTGGILWDKQRGSDKYRQLFAMLDKTGYLEVCGLKQKWRHTPRSYIGFLPIDGVSIIEKTHKAGISLILHSQEHLESAAPTSRIFEAAAANSVIITDRHPFIVEQFGDNVLYIDIDQDAADMFKQIDDHMKWILANPTKAQQLAANCNAIFKNKFSLEDQLDKLINMHNSVQTHKLAIQSTSVHQNS